MSRRVVFAFIALAILFPALAFGQSKVVKKTKIENRWGLLFDVRDLLEVDGYQDGFQAGAGAKFWATDEIAARGLLRIDHENPADANSPSMTILGLGLAGEWHPKGRAGVAPYLGGLAGIQTVMITGLTTTYDVYFGGLFGVECKLFGPINLFGEYQLLASFDENGFEMTLGTDRYDGARALLGLIIYF